MPKPHTSAQVRQDFLDFFREKGHAIVPSASLVPQGDATLLFTNAGMNQFKDVFLGTGTRPYQRAADTQKCLRVSGKHNDLEEVGYDTYHHTFFEMLGNWSFGDYFKRDAIAWAWELLVERWGLPADRLYATVHEGDARLGLEPDREAADLWTGVTPLDPGHVKFCATKDNFWMMGDTGPCGPCSEIHIDLRTDEERAQTPGLDLVNAGDPRVMEIWNLVFIQYNAQPDGSLEPLAARHVDTGMGFERVLAVLQGKSSNYDTDLFAGLLDSTARLAPRADVEGYDAIDTADAAERERVRVAMRVIADHLRTLAFTVADGVVPGNAGRGYVIRRILRRAVRYGYQTLGFREPFLSRLVPALVETMGAAFPELAAQQDYVERVIRAEEEGFLQTLGTGLQSFEVLLPHLRAFAAQEEMPGAGAAARQALQSDRGALDLLQKAYGETGEALLDQFSQAAADRLVPGEVAFLLHDTYGFPADLTALMAREEGFGVGEEAYARLMEEQRRRARAAAHFKVDQSRVDAWQPVREGQTLFVGYDRLDAETEITAYRSVELPDGTRRHEIRLAATPFYAESGGQMGDAGRLVVGGEEIAVLDAQKQQGETVHVVAHLPADVEAGVTARVDAGRRARIAKHHTATHLLHAGLRHVLGPHVQQKGSLVAPERLRFDFSHFERVTPDQLRAVEAWVNGFVQDNVARQEDRDVPIEEALGRGAMALFGEKYGERVRVITFDAQRSVELCGGTHVGATGEIGVFRFVSEGSVAAGVRRVEAVTGMDALAHLWSETDELARVRGLFRNLSRPADAEIEALLEAQRVLERALEKARRAGLESQLDGFARHARAVGDARLATGRLDGAGMDALRDLAQVLVQGLGEGGVALLVGADETGEKANLALAVGDALVARGVQAGKLIGVLARRVGGGGGGRPALATAGGRDVGGLDAVLAQMPTLLAEALQG